MKFEEMEKAARRLCAILSEEEGIDKETKPEDIRRVAYEKKGLGYVMYFHYAVRDVLYRVEHDDEEERFRVSFFRNTREIERGDMEF